jgi:hypothetical protein
MTRYGIALVLIAVTAAVGCGPIPVTPENTEAGCYIQRDDFKKTKVYLGPNLNIGFYNGILYLATDSPTSDLFALQFSFFFRDWYFLENCYAKGGIELPTSQRDREVSSSGSSVNCIERLGVVITRKMCEEYATKPEGLELKFFGKRGNYQVIVPSTYFQGWLNWLKKQTAS